MSRELVQGDAIGALLLDHLEGHTVNEVVQRDDNVFGAFSVSRYFAIPAFWSDLDIAALDGCVGYVLGVGAGAGRASLALSEQGHPVLAPMPLTYAVV